MGETFSEEHSGWIITIWMSNTRYDLWSYRASKGGILKSSAVTATNRTEAMNKVKSEIGA